MPSESPTTRPIALLAAGHAGVDFYQGAVPALVPFLVAERGYGYAAVSGIVLAATLLSSVAQPLFGALADRRRSLPRLLPVSMTTAGAGLALSGAVDSYALTWLAVALSGLGVAAYHPEAARLARAVSGGSHTGMSWFSLGGTVGFALAPLLVTPALSAGGLALTPLLLIPALAAVVLTVAVRPAPDAAAPAPVNGADDWRAFTRLSAVVMLRSVVFIGMSAFIALHAQQRTGGGEAVGGAALFLLFAGSAVGTVLGGRLASRRGRLTVVRAGYLATVPVLAGVLYVPGPLILPMVLAAGITLYLPFSLQITLGQDYLPHRIGTASGVTLGLAVSVGGLAAPALGALADATSLTTALSPLLALSLLCRLIAGTLTEPRSL